MMCPDISCLKARRDYSSKQIVKVLVIVGTNRNNAL
jgi:hypothetical protein